MLYPACWLFGDSWLLKNCELVMTDSGGLQKKPISGKYCDMRDETEWWNLLTMDLTDW